MSVDIERLRADTPACEAHIHFDNAGASLMPAPVFEAMSAHLTKERALGGYGAQRAATDQQNAFYTEVAALLRAQPSEIAFMENSSRAWQVLVAALPWREGDRILTHASEYVANYIGLLHLATQRGVEIDLVESDEYGAFDVEDARRKLTSRTRAVMLTHCPSQGGLINPAEEVGAFAKAHGLWYVLDLCQSAGQIDIDVGKIGCDAAMASGRKFLRGPRGVGFLYVRDALAETLSPAVIDLQSAEWTGRDTYAFAPGARRFEVFERHVAGMIAQGEAVRYAREIGMAAIEARIQALAADLRLALSEVKGVRVHDQGLRKSGIVTFTVDDLATDKLVDGLRAEGVALSLSPGEGARLDLEARGVGDVARASVHAFNTEQEVTAFTEKVAALARS